MPGGWWCCCISPTCDVFEDSFDRADSKDLGPDWEEISGDWSIDTNQLLNDGLGIALVTSTIPVVHGFYVSVKTIDEGSGGNWRIVMNYDPDTGDYYYANFSRDDADNCTLSVGHHDGITNVDTEGDSDGTVRFNGEPGPPCKDYTTKDDGTTRTIFCCLSDRGIFAFTSVAPFGSLTYTAWSGATINPLLSRAGLSGSSTRFDDFYLARDPTNLTLCPTCPCHCGSGYASNKKELLLTIINTNEKCANLEGLQFTLYRGRTCQWYGVVTIPGETGGTGCATVSLNYSDPETCTGFLEFEVGTVCQGEDHNAQPGGTCNPINMTFDGPDSDWILPFCGCTGLGSHAFFEWALTEAP